MAKMVPYRGIKIVQLQGATFTKEEVEKMKDSQDMWEEHQAETERIENIFGYEI